MPEFVGGSGSPPSGITADADDGGELPLVVGISGEERGRGTGRTKKEAEQAAAEEAFRSLRDNEAADA